MLEHRVLRLLMLVLLVSAVPASGQGGPPPARVKLADVEQRSVEQRRPVTGEVRTRLRSTIAGEGEGAVRELRVDLGDTVRAGETLAVLDDTLLRVDLMEAEAQVAAAEATVAVRQAELDASQDELDRVNQLIERGSGTESERTRRRLEVAEASARVREAEALVAVARSRVARVNAELDDTRITAPFTGTVVRKLSEVGAWLSRGDGVVELVSLEDIEVVVNVPENFINRLRPLMRSETEGVPIMVPAAGDEPLMGRLVGIVPQTTDLSRTYPVRFAVSNPDGALRPGMSATAMVPTGETGNAVLVPKDAVLRDDAGEFAFAAIDGVAVPARLTRRFAVGEFLAVESAILRPGVRVVVDGNERLFPSQPLLEAMPDGSARPLGAGGGGGRGPDGEGGGR